MTSHAYRASRLTPLIAVEAIEPSLPFWTERLGFQLTVEMPHGDALGFVILQHGELEVMMQSLASMNDDVPSIMDGFRQGHTVLFVEVTSLDEVERALGDHPLLVPRRETPYGSIEVWVRAPEGTVVGFAEFPKS